MKSTDIIQPKPLSQPIATDGKKNNIPENPTGSELASIAEGFPEITMESIEDGGLPPRGEDCNGMFYLSTDQKVYLQNGGIITFSQEVSDKIGGYPEGAYLDYIDAAGNYSKVKSLIDDNTYNFIENSTYIDGEKWELINFGGANPSLSNLTPEGEKHFLDKTQITNCITEIPQRIKYTLEDGILTVLAGSVFIIPYGIEDLTAQYPVGSTFINDNFKVYDTQFDNNRFFVWVELQNDRSTYHSATDNWTGYIWGNVTSDQIFIGQISESGTDTPQSSGQYYKINENIIYFGGSRDSVITFPIMKATSSSTEITSVLQVFNGVGYIGSVVWVDKDVKGLIPNGRNDDGTCKNISFTTEELCIGNNLGDGLNAPVFITKNPIGILDTNGISRAYQYFEQDIAPDVTTTNVAVWYNTLDNLLYLLWKNQNINDWTPVEFLILGSAYFDSANFKIEKFKPKKVFQAADAQNLDGQWVNKAIALTKLQTLDIGTNIKISYDLSSYLPNDGYTYEVLFSIDFTTGAASGASFNCSMISSINDQDMWLRMAAAQTRATTAVIGAGNAILPIGLTRIVIFNYIAAVKAPIVSIYAEGYRRLGY